MKSPDQSVPSLALHSAAVVAVLIGTAVLPAPLAIILLVACLAWVLTR